MILITYDLKSDHVRVKDELKARGWKDVIVGTNGVSCKLPNTSLWKEGNDSSAAREEVKSVISPPTLEKLIAVSFDSWAGIKGN